MRQKNKKQNEVFCYKSSRQISKVRMTITTHNIPFVTPAWTLQEDKRKKRKLKTGGSVIYIGNNNDRSYIFDSLDKPTQLFLTLK